MNPYYRESNKGLSQTQISNIKKNNFYLYRALNHLVASIEKGKEELGGNYRGLLLSGELPKNDKLTGVSSNRLAEKLKYLVIAISDKNHPENLEKFKNSYFYKNVLLPINLGYTADVDAGWNNFQKSNNVETAFKNKSAYDAALICQRDDLNAPIGFDFSKAIDSIVKTDKDGTFYLDSTTLIEDEVSISEAVNAQLDNLQGNKRFSENYNNPMISYDDLEDEDEKID